MKTVQVLLSSYNGEAFLAEQLDSLLKQEGVHLRILVRDDGSTDATQDILRGYAQRFAQLRWYTGENLGPGPSFMDLLRQAEEADYYAFSDQDDVWDPDKLLCAVRMLEDLDPDKPAMYHANLRIVDRELNYYRPAHARIHQSTNRYSALIEPLATGCTMVFNRPLVELANRAAPKDIVLHDSWLCLLCSLFGTVVYDFTPHISYRQHGGNVVGTYLQRSTAKHLLKRVRRLFDRDMQPRWQNAVRLLDNYGDLLSPLDREKVEELANYKRDLKSRCRLLFDRELRGFTLERELSYRVLILLGLI